MGEKGDKLQVESAKAIEERIRSRKSLRLLWRKSQYHSIFHSEVSAVSDKLLVSEDFVSNQLNEPQTFGSLYEKILRQQAKTGEWAKKFADSEVEQSLFDLRNLVKPLRQETALAARAF